MLRCEQQPVGQETGPSVEGTLGRDTRKLRKIIVFREMGKDYIGGLAVVCVQKKLGCGVI